MSSTSLVDETEILLRIIRERRSIRVFLPDPIPDEHIERIVEAGRWAPSGANGQPCEFIVVKDPKLRSEIATLLEFMGRWEKETEIKHLDKARGQVLFPINSFTYARLVPVWIVVVADPRAKRISIHVGDDSENRIFLQSIGMAIQNMWLTATSLGLATVDVTVRRIQSELKELLKISELMEVTDLLPIGYTDQKRLKDRRPLNEILHHDVYERSKMRSDEWFDKARADLNTLAYMSFGKVLPLKKSGSVS